MTVFVRLREGNKRLRHSPRSQQLRWLEKKPHYFIIKVLFTEKEEILLGGGVACNKRLQAMVSDMAEARGAKFFVPEKGLCIDNGVMIAWLGILMHDAGVKQKIEDTFVRQRYRTDEVEVSWR